MTERIFTLTVDQNWTYYNPKVGDILKYLGNNYSVDKQRTIYCFETIGLSLPQNPPISISWSDEKIGTEVLSTN